MKIYTFKKLLILLLSIFLAACTTVQVEEYDANPQADISTPGGNADLFSDNLFPRLGGMESVIHFQDLDHGGECWVVKGDIYGAAPISISCFPMSTENLYNEGYREGVAEALKNFTK